MTAEAMVAIPAYSLAAGRVRGWDSGAFAVPGPYVAAARRAGLRSVLLPPRDGEGDPPGFEDELRPFAALILIGGGDIDPRSYGAEPHARVYGVDRPRDRYESAVLLAAVRSDLPVLAICRGLQVANVAFGGSLLQHLPDHDRGVPHGDPTGEKGVSHVLTAAPGSRLAAASGAGPLPVHSHHHQGIDRLGDGLVAEAVDALVMMGVHGERPGTRGGGQPAPRRGREYVGHPFLAGRVAVRDAAVVVGEVLEQRAAEGDVRHLQASADGQHRQVRTDRREEHGGLVA